MSPGSLISQQTNSAIICSWQFLSGTLESLMQSTHLLILLRHDLASVDIATP